jgi:hypothetical protein
MADPFRVILCPIQFDDPSLLRVIFPNSNTIGDFDPEIAWRFQYSDDLNRRCA